MNEKKKELDNLEHVVYVQDHMISPNFQVFVICVCTVPFGSIRFVPFRFVSPRGLILFCAEKETVTCASAAT